MISHGNFSRLNCFRFLSFASAALVLVYDYHPGSQTLLAKYFTPTSDTNNYQDPFQGEARPFRYEFNNSHPQRFVRQIFV